MNHTTSRLRSLFLVALAVFGLGLVAQPSQAQASVLEITPFGGVMFGGRLATTGYNYKVKDFANYGLAVDINLKDIVQVEVYYTRSDSTLRRVNYFGQFEDIWAMSVSYIQAGALKEFLQVPIAKNGHVAPFLVGTLGVAHLIPRTELYNSVWRFAFTAGGGVKVLFNKHVGFRVEGRVLMPIWFTGGAFFCGIGGCGVGISSTAAMVQGTVTGGLVIAL